MRVLYFSPVPSEGPSLPMARNLQTALNHFSPLKIIDASVDCDINSWDDLFGHHTIMMNMFDAVLLCVPQMRKQDRPEFFANLRRYTSSPIAKPLIGYFNDTDPQTPFNLVTGRAVYAHRSSEHVGVLATYLVRALSYAAPVSDAPPPYEMGPVVIDYAQRKAFVGGMPAKMTQNHFNLLSFLARRPGRPCSKEVILDALDKGEDIQDKIADVFICKIRQNLSAANPAYPDAGDRFLRTLWGQGNYVVSNITDYDAPLSASASAGKRAAALALLPAPTKVQPS